MDEQEDLSNAALDVLEDIMPAPKAESDPTLVEALRRIEEANLFYTLIKTDVFKDNSARPDILNAVNNKIRQFAKSELNKLLNISQERVDHPLAGIPKDELLALRVLAAKVLKKNPDDILKQQTVRTPQINTVAATPIAAVSAPEVNTVPTPPAVIAEEEKILSQTSTMPPSATQKAAARKALLDKANRRRAEQAKAKAEPARASLPPGGHQGYAVPQNYAPPPQNVIHAAPAPAVAGTAPGVNIGKLIGETLGNGGQSAVATLSDAPIGGDPNVRL